MFIERENNGIQIKFTLRDSEKYTLNELGEAFHRLGNMAGPFMGKTILLIKSVNEEFIFDLTEAE